MADLLLSAVISAVLKKAANSLVQQIAEMWGIRDQQERLHNMLLEIHAVLPNAERRANSNAAIKLWLLKLKAAAYDADDLLDEFCYEDLRRDAVRHGQKVSNLSHFFSLEIPALFLYKMSGKLKKVVQRIDDLVVQMGRFGFGQNICAQVANRSITEDLVVDSKIVGRDNDKEEIVRLLLEGRDSADLIVVPVVGMGGLGKTTLVRLVYNDPRVQEHFELPLWVFVSKKFSIGLIVKSIIELVMGDCSVPTNNRELLKRRLHQALSGRKYLLVLDDVWNENVDKWEHLRAILNCGDSRSAIIVTTRNTKVASIMGTVKSYNLGFLGDDDSWNLFHKRAFSMEVEETEELVEIGRKLVQNCGGLPLAINTLVFPKGYEMDKEKLIQYWMANGFIPSDGPGNLEMKGNDIFNELAWSGLTSGESGEDAKIAFPSLKSMVLSEMPNISSWCEGEVGNETSLVFPVLNRLDINNCPKLTAMPIVPVLEKLSVKGNKTLSCFAARLTTLQGLSLENHRGDSQSANDSLIFQPWEFLNDLSLTGYDSIAPIEWLGSMVVLKELYVRQCENLHCLPSSIGGLTSLEKLEIGGCPNLANLPEGMEELVALELLRIRGCPKMRVLPEAKASQSGSGCSLERRIFLTGRCFLFGQLYLR
ncbi:hypothetical protein LUZ63_008890 [Rhynchospora breviuscula]|uniref:Disease resistance protein RGA3 n=1 Tax=Rhynchospora breviuscula TaxID=2022672 RepID=A0A9Q0CDZ8_9POAL|nr:hypothetical protein LUZ63_008890 [Rhynchospora breviuscula]